MRYALQKTNLVLITVVFALVVSCNRDDETTEPVNTSMLSYYVKQFPDRERDILIACAASEPPSNTDFSVSVYFYPIEGSYDFRYYESSTTGIDPEDFSNYIQVQREFSPVFDGYLQRYHYPETPDERWVILTYLSAGKIHICDPIRLKQSSKPSIYGPEKIAIELTTDTEPLFSWEEDTDNETIIYFHVVSDTTGKLISGTYTIDKHWQFYDLTNVVLNIKDQVPEPALTANSRYQFTLMGVSEDNWVNLIGQKEFITKIQ